MRYLGGKSRLAKSIRDVILTRVESTDVTYYEPFAGGFGSFEIVAPKFRKAVAGDAHEDLTLMWEAVRTGWTPPDVVTEDEYVELRHEEPSALRGFVGFGGSFGGKWFGGYARGGVTAAGEPRNHQAESARNVSGTRDNLIGVRWEVRNGDYRATCDDAQPGDVIYCDPPYANTTGYNTGGFDHRAFWEWCDLQSERGVRVFVSEYSAPEHWTKVFEKTLLSSADLGGRRKQAVDKLFTRVDLNLRGGE